MKSYFRSYKKFDKLLFLQNTLAAEQQSLIAERSNQERMAATISDQVPTCLSYQTPFSQFYTFL
jgi:hypothetical protein